MCMTCTIVNYNKVLLPFFSLLFASSMEMTHSAHALSKCSTPGFNGHMSKTIFLTYAVFVGFSFGLFLPLTLHVSLSLSENRVLTSNEAKFLRDVLLLRMAIIFS